MDFLKNAAQQVSQGNNEELAGMMGGLNNALGQQQGNQPAPASQDSINGLMGTLNNAMNQKSGEGGDSQLSGAMGQLKDTLAGTQNQAQQQGSDPSNPLGGVMNATSSALGGGASGEAKEDKLVKGIDMFQQYVLKEGDQSNESAAEQAKDQQIASAMRTGYKSVTGNDLNF